MAGVAAAELLAGLVVGPLAGVLVDRWRPRRTMLACDLTRLLLILSLAFAPSSATIPWIYAVGFTVACISSFFDPAKGVLLTDIVAPEAIPRALALTQTTQSVALISGPAIGAVLLLAAGPRLGAAADALSFGVSGLALLLISADPAPRLSQSASPTLRHAAHELLADLIDGVALVMGSAGLRALLLVSVVSSVVGNLWFAVDLFFIQRSLHAPGGQVGFLWTASGAGGLLGSLAVALAGPRLSQCRLLLLGLAVRGLALLWYATTHFAPAIPAAAVAGLGDALLLVALGSLTLRWAARDAVGRTTALIAAAAQVGSLTALVSVTALQHLLTPAQVLLLCGFALVATTPAAWLLLRGALDAG